MDIQGLNPVLPVDDLGQAVAVWSALLGAAPTFVDGDRWAQFDVGGRRLALAGTDRVSPRAGVMIKVADLTAALDAAKGQGLAVGEPQQGPHEVRCVVMTPGGWPAIFYQPIKV
jgi:hypothetical protein